MGNDMNVKNKSYSKMPSSSQSATTLPPIRSSTFVVDNPSMPNPPRIEDSVQKLTLAQVKQMKKSEMKHKNRSGAAETIEILDSHNRSGNKAGNSPRQYNNLKSIETILKNAQATGTLNLSDQDLPEVPPKVFGLNEIDSKEYAKNTSANFESDDSKWWNQVELKKLILAFNRITHIPRQIEQLSTLVVLDVHDNQIEMIDEAIGRLTLLETLNISNNQLRQIPNSVVSLKNLKTFNCSGNALTQLPKNIGDLSYLEALDVSNNQLSTLPSKSFSWLTSLLNLNLSKNSLKHLDPEIFYPPNLKMLDVSENQIERVSKEISNMANVEQLYMRHNKLKKLPFLEKCFKLKDWDVSFNSISVIEENSFDNLPYLVNFNIRDNQLDSLPVSIAKLTSLERLDLVNNNLTGLPSELGTVEPLKQILLTGNPMRSIRKDIMNRGTEAIMKHLKNQLQETNTQLKEDQIAKEAVISNKSTRILDLSSKKLTNLNSDVILVCKSSDVLSLNLSRNQLQDLPPELDILNDQLKELNLSANCFTQLPRPLLDLKSLVTLDLRGNKLNTVPFDICRLTSLREVTLSDNKLKEFPPGLYELPILENIFISNNQIEYIDPFKIINMKHLATLNIQNNNLHQVPAELGMATQLKALMLEGNAFRVPNSQILAKGTPAILDYLRNRLPR